MDFAAMRTHVTGLRKGARAIINIIYIFEKERRAESPAPVSTQILYPIKNNKLPAILERYDRKHA